ncbi:hypothetical protein AVEN_81369-1 [Araneus ventricosus]|uniref:Uncharacterized protein n=1 Tax=Araneus ventricosus TaxID=182803 RepID=A0A4Y2B6E0_ARAVE|nr:hypothetical protein AVEN_81369-1 [Araneus ventricosus]
MDIYHKLNRKPTTSLAPFIIDGNPFDAAIRHIVSLSESVEVVWFSVRSIRRIKRKKQYLIVLEELSRKIPPEGESDALHLDGEVTEYSGQETDFETDVEDNPIHEEYNDSDSNTNVCIIHPFNLESYYTLKNKNVYNKISVEFDKNEMAHRVRQPDLSVLKGYLSTKD